MSKEDTIIRMNTAKANTRSEVNYRKLAIEESKLKARKRGLAKTKEFLSTCRYSIKQAADKGYGFTTFVVSSWRDDAIHPDSLPVDYWDAWESGKAKISAVKEILESEGYTVTEEFSPGHRYDTYSGECYGGTSCLSIRISWT